MTSEADEGKNCLMFSDIFGISTDDKRGKGKRNKRYQSIVLSDRS